MAHAFIIVESPAKARTISRFLGDDYIVESSIGHIRDLPSTASEIPAKYKKEKWARLGVDVNQDFKPLYVIPSGKKKQVDTLKKKLKDATELYLATDEDREGEAIAWHLIEVLKPKIPVKRLVFHEITTAPPSPRPSSPRGRSTTNSSPPRRRDGSSTASSATRSHRCCGASCAPSSRPDACSRWPPVSSSPAKSRGCGSSRADSAGSRPDSPSTTPRSRPASPSSTTARSPSARTSTPRPGKPKNQNVLWF